jgi:hypothetical protein
MRKGAREAVARVAFHTNARDQLPKSIKHDRYPVIQLTRLQSFVYDENQNTD